MKRLFKSRQTQIEVDGHFLTFSDADEYGFLKFSFYTYHIFFKKKNSKKLLIFFNGAIDRSKGSPPVFQRKSWIDAFDVNILILDDPTINNENDIKLGWYIGNVQENVQYHIIQIIKAFLKSLNIDQSDTYCFGSSAGGFMAMITATHLRKVTAIVNNPQTDVFKYHAGIVESFTKENFGHSDLQNYTSRFSVLDLIQKLHYIPKVFYWQNIYDEFHYLHHYLNFQKVLNDIVKSKTLQVNIECKVYSDPKAKHNPLSKELTIQYINEILDKPQN